MSTDPATAGPDLTASPEPLLSFTTAKALPWPQGTDLVRDGDDAIRKLAQSVDNMVQAGTFSQAMNNNAQVTGVASFPVPYSAPPIVVVACSTAAGNHLIARLNSGGNLPGPVSASQFAWVLATTDGTTSNATPSIYWIAVGPVVAVT